MARALLRFRKDDSVFWVQDYHFLALGCELRDLGVTQPIGFFLHTPWPSRAIIGGVPHHRELIEAMLAYDLIGFQTDEDCENFLSYVQADLGLAVRDGVVSSRHGRTRAAVFPIGIDPEKFAQQASQGDHPSRRVAAAAQPQRREARDRRRPAGLFERADQPHQGVRSDVDAAPAAQAHHLAAADRDALARRDRGLRQPAERTWQISSPTSTARHGEVDWTPIRYLNKGFGQAVLAGLYRTAQVGVVTPLQDGMNLVAKEYVAAQNPADPGVLVLSQFAGAANELDTALLVNPHDIDGMARTIAIAAIDAASRAASALGRDDGQDMQPYYPSVVRRFHRRAAGDAIRGNRPGAARADPLWSRRSADAGARYH